MISPGALQANRGEASRASTRSFQTHEPLSVSQSSLNDAPAPQKVGLPFRNRRLRSRWGISLRRVLAAIASASAVALLISLCAAAYLRAAPLQLTRRRLSEGGSPESNKGLAACRETSEAGLEDDLPAFLLEEESRPPPAKKAKVEEEGSEADEKASFQPHPSLGSQDDSAIATADVAAGAVASAPQAQPPLESPMSSDEAVAAHALLSLWGGEASAAPEQTPPGLAFEQQAQLPTVLTQQVQLTAAPHQQAQPHPALMQQVQFAPAFEQYAQFPFYLLQQAIAGPSLAFVPVSTVLPASSLTLPVLTSPTGLVSPNLAEVGGLSSQSAQVQFAAPCPWAPPHAPPESFPQSSSQEESSDSPLLLRTKLLSTKRGMEIIDPLGTWEPPPPSQARVRVVREHAYSRLPRLDEGYLYSALVDPLSAVSGAPTPNIKSPSLRKLSILLAQDTLSPSHLRRMGELVERLLNHLTFNEGGSIEACPSYAVESLGFRFILLDLTVSSLQLLGVPCSGQWWDRMVSRIPDEYPYQLKRLGEDLARFNFNLMIQLTSAIRTLKSGHRPEAKVLVHLKRCLFCCVHSPLRFLKPAWDHWREHDKLYYQQFEGTAGQRDPAQPGPSHQSSW
ncbi:hypothetical protein Emed_004912 [Eimeria media]